jgi:hypothetical protein
MAGSSDPLARALAVAPATALGRHATTDDVQQLARLINQERGLGRLSLEAVEARCRATMPAHQDPYRQPPRGTAAVLPAARLRRNRDTAFPTPEERHPPLPFIVMTKTLG